MGKVSLKIILMYILLIIYTFISIVLQVTNRTPYYTNIINPFVWMALAGYALYILYDKKTRVKAKTDKAQTVLIIIMFYLIIYFFLGMFFGYARSPYSHEIIDVIKNIWCFAVIIIFQEIVRTSVLPSAKMKWYWYLLPIVLFTLSEISFYRFENHFVDLEVTFKYSSSVLLPVLARNILFTYLSLVGGYWCNLCYRIPIILANLIMPIFPDFEWFWISLIDLIIVIVVFIEINYKHEKKTARESRRKAHKDKLINKIPLLIGVVLLVSFIVGVFKYMPVAIMSNSMASLINRGDLVLLKKLDEEEKKKLEVNDIVSYQLDGSIIVHRIIKIDKISEEEYLFTTKGDNNKHQDVKKVELNQIKSKVLFRVPKIGYPVVLMNELFQKSKDTPDVELGNG